MTDTYILNTDILNSPSVFSKYFSIMSTGRQDKINRLKKDRDKLLSLGAGVLLDHVLSLFNMREKTAEIFYAKNGKPYLKNTDAPFFSLSHSKNYVLCSVSENEVGADIQEIIPCTDKLIKKTLSKSESDFIFSLNEQYKNDTFIRLWTAKESYLKLTGSGITVSPSSVEFIIQDPLLLVFSPFPVYFKEYSLPGYKITICSKSNNFAAKLKPVTSTHLNNSLL